MIGKSSIHVILSLSLVFDPFMHPAQWSYIHLELGVKSLTNGPTCTSLTSADIRFNACGILTGCLWHSDQTRKDATMLWAVETMCFLEQGRLLHHQTHSIYLLVNDITTDSHTSPTHITVNMKASKMDPFR